MLLDRNMSDDGKVLTIVMANKFDFEIVQQFREHYAEIDTGVEEVIVDLRLTQYMDSSALGMLLNMEKSLSGKVARIRLINCKTAILNIFKISRFDKKFIIE
ncbi:STAS domain-containing protein [Alteromonadaceae bacterium BrNp21-10]|nr:STAS domain-containing protein [Alteromonadaceae bacterium BrNp21-10]